MINCNTSVNYNTPFYCFKDLIGNIITPMSGAHDFARTEGVPVSWSNKYIKEGYERLKELEPKINELIEREDTTEDLRNRIKGTYIVALMIDWLNSEQVERFKQNYFNIWTENTKTI